MRGKRRFSRRQTSTKRALAMQGSGCGRETAPAPRPAPPRAPRFLRAHWPQARSSPAWDCQAPETSAHCPLRSATVPCVRSGEQLSSIEHVSVLSVWPTLCLFFHHAGFAELSVSMQAMRFTFSFNHSLTRIRRHQCGISASWVPRIEGKIALPGPWHNTMRRAPDRARCTHGCDVIPKVALLRAIAFLTTSRGSNGREYRKPSAMRWNNSPIHD